MILNLNLVTALLLFSLYSSHFQIHNNIIVSAAAVSAESTTTNENTKIEKNDYNSNEDECSIDELEASTTKSKATNTDTNKKAVVSNKDDECSIDETPTIKEGRRLITVEELVTKTGKNNTPIWLSVMGQVYDVTKGKRFYGIGSGYEFFAAKDASASFATGKFDEEGMKHDLHTNVTRIQIKEIEHWRSFYYEHEQYFFVGFLIDGRFYDEDGAPTYLLKKWRMNLRKMEEEKKAKKATGLKA